MAWSTVWRCVAGLLVIFKMAAEIGSTDTGGALANAVYKATGVRMYKQPFMNEAPFKS
jgi:CO/xanthine dehydrogenase Mo-binding subunit